MVGATPVNDGNWHHVVLTWQSSSGEANIYVDGNLADTVTVNPGATLNPNTPMSNHMG